MRTLSVFCCLFTVLLTMGAEINIEGNEGGEVSFKCSHKLAWNNQKYFCKDPCKSTEDILVSVSPGETSKSGRITLVDSEDGSFTVNITHLHLSDTRVYWCAVIRSVSTTYTSVKLTVQKAFKSTVPPTVSSPWFLIVTNSTQMTDSMAKNATENILGEINGIAANGTTVSLSPLLCAAVGTAAALIIFILAMYFRKRRDMPKPQLQARPHDRDPMNEVTDKISSEGIQVISDHTGQGPKSTTGQGSHCPVSLPVYENLPRSSDGSGSTNSPAVQQNIHDVENRIYITLLPSVESEINSVSQSVSTGLPPRLLWFGLDASQINPI